VNKIMQQQTIGRKQLEQPSLRKLLTGVRLNLRSEPVTDPACYCHAQASQTPRIAGASATIDGRVFVVGGWEGHVATLKLEKVNGEHSKRGLPGVSRDPDFGTISLEFHDCDNAILSYELLELSLMGTIGITRVVKDNVLV
jgi:hypothetical protein